jgi:hypothetical protein
VVIINFEKARDNAYRYTGPESNLSRLLRNSPSLLKFIAIMRENQSGSRNKLKLDWRHSKMKVIHCNVTNLLNETITLKKDNSSVCRKNAFDVAVCLKDQLEEFVCGKPETDNHNRKPKNSRLRGLLNLGVSGQSLVGVHVKKLFNAGWFKGRIAVYYPGEDLYHIDYVDGDGEDYSMTELHELVELDQS